MTLPLSLQVSESGVHRPHVAGIHGRSTDGAYSLVLAGGYEDDVVSDIVSLSAALLFTRSPKVNEIFVSQLN